MIKLINKLLYDLYEKRIENKKNEKEYDKKVYLKIKNKILPLNGSIGFLKDFNFGLSFKLKDFSDIYNISNNESDNIELVFLDENLEKLKKKLFLSINSFVSYLCITTGDDGYGYEVSRKLKIENPKEYHEQINNLHNHTSNIWKEYSNFINYGRKRFKI